MIPESGGTEESLLSSRSVLWIRLHYLDILFLGLVA